MSNPRSVTITDLGDLAVGLVLPKVTFNLDKATIISYIDSVEDKTSIFRSEGFVPPLAIAAIAKKRLMEALHIPDGAVQSQAVFDFLGGVKPGELLYCSGVISEYWKRNNVNYVAVNIRVAIMDGKCILKGKMGFILAPSTAGGTPL